MGALSRLAALSGEERRLLVAAAALLPVVDLALRTFGYRLTHAALARAAGARTRGPRSPAERRARARRVARCVRIAARRGPYRAGCLRESLVTWWLLRRGGIAADLTLGVGKERGRFAAHAWVEVDGAAVVEPPDGGPRFTPIHRAGGRQAAR
jgi:hypothetical protein